MAACSELLQQELLKHGNELSAGKIRLKMKDNDGSIIELKWKKESPHSENTSLRKRFSKLLRRSKKSSKSKPSKHQSECSTNVPVPTEQVVDQEEDIYFEPYMDLPNLGSLPDLPSASDELYITANRNDVKHSSTEPMYASPDILRRGRAWTFSQEPHTSRSVPNILSIEDDRPIENSDGSDIVCVNRSDEQVQIDNNQETQVSDQLYDRSEAEQLTSDESSDAEEGYEKIDESSESEEGYEEVYEGLKAEEGYEDVETLHCFDTIDAGSSTFLSTIKYVQSHLDKNLDNQMIRSSVKLKTNDLEESYISIGEDEVNLDTTKSAFQKENHSKDLGNESVDPYQLELDKELTIPIHSDCISKHRQQSDGEATLSGYSDDDRKTCLLRLYKNLQGHPSKLPKKNDRAEAGSQALEFEQIHDYEDIEEALRSFESSPTNSFNSEPDTDRITYLTNLYEAMKNGSGNYCTWSPKSLQDTDYMNMQCECDKKQDAMEHEQDLYSSTPKENIKTDYLGN